MNILLWVVLPYATIVVLVARLDLALPLRQVRLDHPLLAALRVHGAALGHRPMFHFGVLFVLVGHIGGLLIPKSWTEAVGISEHAYHLTAVFLGTVAGFCTLIGLAILIARRRLIGPVFTATTKNDKAMYVVLAGAIVLGLLATVRANIARRRLRLPRNRLAVVPVAVLPAARAELMADVPLGFQLHLLVAFALFAFWPFTRLVHAFSAPVGYLTRPYVVYRSRDARPGARAGLAPAARPGGTAHIPKTPPRTEHDDNPDAGATSRRHPQPDRGHHRLPRQLLGVGAARPARARRSRRQLGLSFAAQSLLVAVPVLVGSLGRIPVGALTDRFGARVMFPIVSLATIVPVLTLASCSRPTGR